MMIFAEPGPINTIEFSPESNEVNFNSADAPDDGEVIEITYAILGCQEEEIEDVDDSEVAEDETAAPEVIGDDAAETDSSSEGDSE